MTKKTVYVSQCCNVPATKPPCAMERGQRVSREIGNVPKDREATLGKWRCTSCRKHCKVNPVRQEEKK
jgi:hypothetical protein